MVKFYVDIQVVLILVFAQAFSARPNELRDRLSLKLQGGNMSGLRALPVSFGGIITISAAF
jgi:hypothetical protein